MVSGLNGNDARCVPKVLHHAQNLVTDRGSGRGRILRIERHHQNAVAALRHQRVEAFADRRVAVAHGPVDDDLRVVQRSAELFRLRPGDRLQRRLVLVRVPDFLVVARLARRPEDENDAVENQLPEQSLLLDHAGVRQELAQIDAHALRIGRVGRAQIHQQHADALQR
jgi:hypothetical protein